MALERRSFPAPPRSVPGECLRHPRRVAPSPSKALPQGALLLVLITLSCGGGLTDPCHCTPSAPVSDDYRHLQKHVPLPSGTPQEISINTLLGWAQDPTVPSNQPRTGRELQLFRIAKAYVQSAGLMSNDCA